MSNTEYVIKGKLVACGFKIAGTEYSPREAAALLKLLIEARDSGHKILDLSKAKPETQKKIVNMLGGLLLARIAYSEYLGDNEPDGTDISAMYPGPWKVTVLPEGLRLLKEDGL